MGEEVASERNAYMFDKNLVSPRPEITSRHYKTFMYQPTDRVPDIEFSYWSQTLRRWVGEGMDVGVAIDDPTFHEKVHEYFGYDNLNHHHIGCRVQMDPLFEETVIERKERSVISRNSSGVTAEYFEDSQQESSIPHYIEFPVKSPADWPDMKRRFNSGDADRARPAEEIDRGY